MSTHKLGRNPLHKKRVSPIDQMMSRDDLAIDVDSVSSMSVEKVIEKAGLKKRLPIILDDSLSTWQRFSQMKVEFRPTELLRLLAPKK